MIAPVAGLALVLLAAAPALGHVEPEVSTVPAGSLATVDFTVEHGCEGSPTVKMEFQVPDGITDAQPAEKAGWTGALVDGVVTYTGGSLPADQEDTFAVRFTVPDQVQAVLMFPMIQTCETGSIDWIQTEGEAERPAPRVVVGEPDPNAPVPPPSSAPTTAAPTTMSVPSTTDSTATAEEDLGEEDATPATTTPRSTAASPSDSDTGIGISRAAPWAIGGLGVAGLAGLLVVRRRARPDGPDGTDGADPSDP